MGMGSKMKRSSSGNLVMSCVVLSLALLVVRAAAVARNSPDSCCKEQCSGRQDYKPCHAACWWGMHLRDLPNCHLRCRYAKHYDTCFEQCKKEQEGSGGRVGLLAAPAEGQNQGEEAKPGGAAGLLEMPTELAG
ncbi:hypothetical protein CFC21_090755 [Triticum aestivum]|uniref:Uncharacterized protein n=2 Tax=Triticum aestivum TaxID=4565 RepID=A0A9R1LEY5_WHEAT|nr:hypothetical protein CFC21_090755 [Triticum aestivum]